MRLIDADCPNPEPKGEDWEYEMWWDAVNGEESEENDE